MFSQSKNDIVHPETGIQWANRGIKAIDEDNLSCPKAQNTPSNQIYAIQTGQVTASKQQINQERINPGIMSLQSPGIGKPRNHPPPPKIPQNNKTR
eukprot:1672920-Amphidinium_carterae.1